MGQLDITNEFRKVNSIPEGDHKAPINRHARKHSKHKSENIRFACNTPNLFMHHFLEHINEDIKRRKSKDRDSTVNKAPSSFTGRSKAVLLMSIHYVICVSCLACCLVCSMQAERL